MPRDQGLWKPSSNWRRGIEIPRVTCKLPPWCRCDLSYLPGLRLYGSSSSEVELSIMEAYNIGENLEFLHLGSEPYYDVLLRASKLKELRSIDLLPVPPDLPCASNGWC